MLMQNLVQHRMKRHEPELAALAAEPEPPALEVDLRPAKRRGLAESQPGVGEQEEGELLAPGADRQQRVAAGDQRRTVFGGREAARCVRQTQRSQNAALDSFEAEGACGDDWPSDVTTVIARRATRRCGLKASCHVLMVLVAFPPFPHLRSDLPYDDSPDRGSREQSENQIRDSNDREDACDDDE
jgi:hypothetical protein